MKNIKLYLMLIIAHVISFVLKFVLKSGGTSFVGLMMLKLDSEFLTKTSKYTNTIINITGTNGKTTTSGLLSHIIKYSSNSVLNNAEGANMPAGIATTYALSGCPIKKYDYAVLETDEGYLPKVYDTINADYLLVTNLFRDQLDRFGELDNTARKIQEAIDKNSDLQLILNADDPMVVNFNTNGSKSPIYYGFNNVEYKNNTNNSKTPAELINCPHCKNTLKYDVQFYAQQGHYYCECGYKRPECKYLANVCIYDTYSEISINNNGKDYVFSIPLPGLYNAYNALAAISLAFEIGLENFETSLSTYKTAFGRSEVKNINGKNAIIQLIKNPTGAGEVLKTIDINSNILIIMNDNYADGRDVSWIWDTDFEILNSIQNEIVTSGIRAYDVALRLKYAGINNIKVISDIDEAIKYVTSNNGNNKITILPTYTALLHINKKGA